MKLVVLESASDEVEAIHRYISEHNPLAAERIKDRITARIRFLARSGFADLGRPGRVPSTRELVEGSYIITYRHDRVHDEIVVLSVVHGARRR